MSGINRNVVPKAEIEVVTGVESCNKESDLLWFMTAITWRQGRSLRRGKADTGDGQKGWAAVLLPSRTGGASGVMRQTATATPPSFFFSVLFDLLPPTTICQRVNVYLLKNKLILITFIDPFDAVEHPENKLFPEMAYITVAILHHHYWLTLETPST